MRTGGDAHVAACPSTSSLDYLHGLQARYGSVVVDCQDIHKWGGTDYDWTNATHVDRANMRRMLRYIVAHSAEAAASPVG